MNCRRRRDPLTESPNPIRLYRIPERGKIAGVCAGFADYFGFRDWHARVAAIVLLLIFTPQTIIAYLVAAALMPRRPHQPAIDTEEEQFWRSVTGKPERTFHALRHKFRELEARLAGLERHVTSSEFALNRQFRDLEK